jgi:hypothetical protein
MELFLPLIRKSELVINYSGTVLIAAQSCHAEYNLITTLCPVVDR